MGIQVLKILLHRAIGAAVDGQHLVAAARDRQVDHQRSRGVASKDQPVVVTARVDRVARFHRHQHGVQANARIDPVKAIGAVDRIVAAVGDDGVAHRRLGAQDNVIARTRDDAQSPHGLARPNHIQALRQAGGIQHQQVVGPVKITRVQRQEVARHIGQLQGQLAVHDQGGHGGADHRIGQGDLVALRGVDGGQARQLRLGHGQHLGIGVGTSRHVAREFQQLDRTDHIVAEIYRQGPASDHQGVIAAATRDRLARARQVAECAVVDKDIVAGIAHQAVHARAPHQGVGAVAAHNAVGPRSAQHREAAIVFGRTIPGQRVRAAQAHGIDRQGRPTGHQGVQRGHAGQAIAQGDALNVGDVVEVVGGAGARAVAKGQGVGAITAVQGVGHRQEMIRNDQVVIIACEDAVAARATQGHGVGPIARDNGVAAIACHHRVGAGARDDGVGLVAARDGVVLATAQNAVSAVALGRAIPGQGVAACQGRGVEVQGDATGDQGIDRDDAGQAVAQHNGFHLGHPVQVVGLGGAGAVGEVQDIAARTAVQGVGRGEEVGRHDQVVADPGIDDVAARAAQGDGVVAITTEDGIVAIACDQRVGACARDNGIGLVATGDRVGLATAQDAELAVGFGRTVPGQGVAARQGACVQIQGRAARHQVVNRRDAGQCIAQHNGLDPGDMVEIVGGAGARAVGKCQGIGAGATIQGIGHGQVAVGNDQVVVVSREQAVASAAA